MIWHVCTPEVAPSQNAPQGVEKVHFECRIDIESSDRGNNTLAPQGVEKVHFECNWYWIKWPG